VQSFPPARHANIRPDDGNIRLSIPRGNPALDKLDNPLRPGHRRRAAFALKRLPERRDSNEIMLATCDGADRPLAASEIDRLIERLSRDSH
jgi:hypothetical protein